MIMELMKQIFAANNFYCSWFVDFIKCKFSFNILRIITKKMNLEYFLNIYGYFSLTCPLDIGNMHKKYKLNLIMYFFLWFVKLRYVRLLFGPRNVHIIYTITANIFQCDKIYERNEECQRKIRSSGLRGYSLLVLRRNLIKPCVLWRL